MSALAEKVATLVIAWSLQDARRRQSRVLSASTASMRRHHVGGA
jgi:hypothetical protein